MTVLDLDIVQIQIKSPDIEQQIKKIPKKEIKKFFTEFLDSYISKTKKQQNKKSFDEIDKILRESKPTNIKRAEKVKKAIEGLGRLIDPDKKNLTLNEVKELYYKSKYGTI